MEAWERTSTPLALRLLWVVAADPYIVCFKVKQLVKACRLASAEDLQHVELPEEARNLCWEPARVPKKVSKALKRVEDP